MKDQFHDRMWIDNHERFSTDLGQRLDRIAARFSGRGDPLPIVARAMALVMAVSLTSLSLSIY